MQALVMIAMVLGSAPPDAGAEADGGANATLTFMAYNVLYDAVDDAKSVEAIGHVDPDVLCLSELTPKFVKVFDAGAGKKLTHRALAPKKGTWGVGIASKFPVTDAQVFEEKPHQIPGIEARVHTPQGIVRVACLHLFPPVGKHRKRDTFLETMAKNATLRAQQATYIIERFSKESGPMVILGDMNEGPDGDAIKAFGNAGYVRSCSAKESHCGGTWPGATSSWPAMFEIDHVFGKRVTWDSAAVLKAGGSDHYPVVARGQLAK